jgi:hypothetical protein
VFYASSAALLLLCGLFTGCGRSVAPAAQPTGGTPVSAEPSSADEAGPASAPQTLEQAEAELEQARLALAQVGGLSAPAGAAAAPPPSPVAPSANEQRPATADDARSVPKASAPSRAEKKSADQAEAEGSARDGNSCETTCKAYASLLRAKSAVCRLDAPNGARCARAEGIVRDATPQVQSCQCAL